MLKPYNIGSGRAACRCCGRREWCEYYPPGVGMYMPVRGLNGWIVDPKRDYPMYCWDCILMDLGAPFDP